MGGGTQVKFYPKKKFEEGSTKSFEVVLPRALLAMLKGVANEKDAITL